MIPGDAGAGYEALRVAARSAGLACRGGFHPTPADGVPPTRAGEPAGTLILLGFTGGEQWPVFAASPESRDGLPDPLDRWSRRVIDALAVRFGASALYPAPGPPWWPFQRWAERAESVYRSPLGILIHPEYGLWHAYRGALTFGTFVALPTQRVGPNPCERCTSRPCLHTCPVGAVQAGQFDHRACGAHLATSGNRCRPGGCLARLACPVGTNWRYGDAQAAFHMQALG